MPAPPPTLPRLALAAWPYRDYWTAIVFNGAKIGYAHVEVLPAGASDGTYEIRAESALRLRFLGFDKRVTLRSRDRVRADLTLEAFDYDYDIDGGSMRAVEHPSAYPAGMRRKVMCGIFE